jgi:hypothetical protein
MNANSHTSVTQYRAKINLDPRTNLMIALDGLQFDQTKILGYVHAIDNNLSMVKKVCYMVGWLTEAKALAAAQKMDTNHNKKTLLQVFIKTLVGNVATDEWEKSPLIEQRHGDYQALKKSSQGMAKICINGSGYICVESLLPNSF